MSEAEDQLLKELRQLIQNERAKDENFESEEAADGRDFLATHYAGRVSAWITMERMLREIRVDYAGERSKESGNPAL